MTRLTTAIRQLEAVLAVPAGPPLGHVAADDLPAGDLSATTQPTACRDDPVSPANTPSTLLVQARSCDEIDAEPTDHTTTTTIILAGQLGTQAQRTSRPGPRQAPRDGAAA